MIKDNKVLEKAVGFINEDIKKMEQKQIELKSYC